ncbi:hypothetical protein HDU85_004746 [Gaertneriomyces sp. JEL0708]|nr:hypothetical protein HDU85_004746 [Gaertneriomyces sp. JEL0708]
MTAASSLVAELIRRRVQERPNATAILWCAATERAQNIKRYTYEEVWGDSSQIANALKERLYSFSLPTSDEGLPPRIGIAVDEGVELTILMLAVLMISPAAALVPLDLTDPRLPLIVEDAEPALVIVADDEAKHLYLRAISRDDTAAAHCVTVNELRQSATARKDVDFPEVYPQAIDQVSHIYFTSGSTGRPKGCIATNRALTSYCLAKNLAHDVVANSTVFVASTHTFDPSLGDFMSALVAGATIAIAPKGAIFAGLAQYLSLTAATHLLTTPSLFSTIDDLGPRDLPFLKVIALGGEPTPQAIVTTWSKHVKLINTYGVTECCVYQAACVLRDGVHRKCIGEPLSGNRILVMSAIGGHEQIPHVDPLDMVSVVGSECPERSEIGEIWIAGTQVGNGYLKRPDLTALKFINHPDYGRCYRTGDIVVWDQPSMGWKLLGRIDTQVKIAGKRVEVEEIEHSLMSEATTALLVSAVIVFHWSKILVAYCVPQNSDIYLDEQEGVRKPGELLSQYLRYLCERALPRHMVPVRFILVRGLPRTKTGKFARKELAERTLGPSCQGDDDEDHGTDTSRLGGWLDLVLRVWSEMLQGRIRRSDHFLERGGDSLTALKVCQVLAREFRSKQQSSVEALDQCEGVFGELLGALAPGELLKRPMLEDYAAYLHESLGPVEANAGHTTRDTQQQELPSLESSSVVEPMVFKAAGQGAVSVLKHLLEVMKVHPDGTQKGVRATGYRTTPLHCAAVNSHLETCRLLLDHGASLSALDSNGATPLHLACQSGSPALISLLMARLNLSLKKGRKAIQHPLLRPDVNGQLPLHHAARGGASPTVIDVILECYSDPAAMLTHRDKWGRLPLHWAVVNGHRDTVRAFIKWGSDPKAADAADETAIDISERRARCGDNGRDGVRPSVFGDISKLMGGSGKTANVGKFLDK